MTRFAATFTVVCCSAAVLAADAPPDFVTHVMPVLRKYCTGCHNPKEKEGGLDLETFAALSAGGEHGKILAPGKPDGSRMIRLIERNSEPFMPPEDQKAPTKAEVAILKAWIKAGAKGPAGSGAGLPKLVTPSIKPTGKVRRPVSALAFAPNGKLYAVARHNAVELHAADTGKIVETLKGHTGQVNDLAFTQDGRVLAVASGESGLYGEVTLWSTTGWKKLDTLRGHRDSIYAVAISPDGRMLATGSYDHSIILWDAADGKKLRTLTGHNGPLFDLAFHPGGRWLASASGDRTVKLWDVATGRRLDTLTEPEKDQYTCAFSPDGRVLAAGGVDNRVRVWSIGKTAAAGTNRILYARFAHEAPILRLAFSPDGRRLVTSAEDRTIKLWETRSFTQTKVLKNQPDWAAAIAVSPNGAHLLAGRLDGSLSSYPLNNADDGIRSVDPIDMPPVPRPHGSQVANLPSTPEREPNDLAKAATPMKAPGQATGVLMSADGSDADLYRFSSQAGRTWIIETNAARSKSPADTKIEVLDVQGRPVLRYLLRAVRDSYITFRPIDSRQNQVRVKNWEEMQLNQFLYMNGEVGKLFRMPEGPDSGFLFYTVGGKRRCYFDTSATVHAKEDSVYIVEPYPPGTPLVDNGLPVFELFYENDDDGDRKLGNDSQLTFTAPADGEYLVRVTDVRGFGGKDFKYTLTVREPAPDFQASIAAPASVPTGSGQRFTVKLNRIDGFTGPVRVDVSRMPDGFSVTTPVVVEAGHVEARGAIHVAPRMKSPKGAVAAPRPADWSKLKVTATAIIHGKKVAHNVGGLKPVKAAAPAKYVPTIDLAGANELVIAPGETISTTLRIVRNKFNGEVRFDVDNLPHGVIVDNLGLSGIMIRQGETHRQVFISAAPWVPESTRLAFAVGRSQGNQASKPIVFKVRRRELTKVEK